jgi:hypothetical protein
MPVTPQRCVASGKTPVSETVFSGAGQGSFGPVSGLVRGWFGAGAAPLSCGHTRASDPSLFRAGVPRRCLRLYQVLSYSAVLRGHSLVPVQHARARTFVRHHSKVPVPCVNVRAGYPRAVTGALLTGALRYQTGFAAVAGFCHKILSAAPGLPDRGLAGAVCAPAPGQRGPWPGRARKPAAAGGMTAGRCGLTGRPRLRRYC